jgi:transaldolase
LPAVRQLIAKGINVNVTLLFGLGRYREVLETWLNGLEDRAQAGLPLTSVASVASFFLSRMDTAVDKRLDALAGAGSEKSATALRGEAAISCARLAYQIYRETVESGRWRRLSDRGAQSQRLLWASTGTKDPAYSEVKYVEDLIGPDTVNTLPPETLHAYRKHGDPALRLEQELARASDVPASLAGLGIDLEAVARQLEEEGPQAETTGRRLLFPLVGAGGTPYRFVSRRRWIKGIDSAHAAGKGRLVQPDHGPGQSGHAVSIPRQWRSARAGSGVALPATGCARTQPGD